jgi:hypothetical protein
MDQSKRWNRNTVPRAKHLVLKEKEEETKLCHLFVLDGTRTLKIQDKKRSEVTCVGEMGPMNLAENVRGTV